MAPASDLFATRFNNKLPQFVSPLPIPLAWAVDALSLLWEDLNVYAFPPVAILGKVVEKLQDHPCHRIILIAPGWPNMSWFWELVAMSSRIPLSLPSLLTEPFNQPQLSRNRASLRQWEHELRSVYEARWTIFTKWCLSNQVDFRAPPVKSIADLLLFLLRDRKLQPSTIDGYRSAMADKLDNSPINVSKNENLPRFLDSFHRDRPKRAGASPPGTSPWSYTS